MGPIGPVRPTFPAYSPPSTSFPSQSSQPGAMATAASSGASPSNATITGAPTIKKPESSSGMSIKLVHPDEDISLVSRINL